MTGMTTASATEDPARSLAATLADPRFRAWQAAWRRRIAYSRRVMPLANGTVDPLAPTGRWAC